MAKEKLRRPRSSQTEVTHPLNLTFVAYNVVYWIPMILSFTKIIEYRTGFIAFFIIIIIRAIANLYRNNALKLERAVPFPLRIP